MVPMLHHIFNDYDDINDLNDDNDEYIDYFQTSPLLEKVNPTNRAYIEAYQRALQTTVPVEQCSKGALQCGICLDIPLYPISTECNHMFCIDCIQKYMFRKVIRHHCPSCRFPNVSFDSMKLDSEPMKQWKLISVTCNVCKNKVNIATYKNHQCVNK